MILIPIVLIIAFVLYMATRQRKYKTHRVVKVPKNGQRVWELNLITLEMSEPDATGKKYLDAHDDCIYCFALNEKNAIKQFNKMVPGTFEKSV